MGIKLFDDAIDNEELEKIEINPEFAKRYEHNKKREDLEKLEVLKKKGIAESSTESDSDSSESDSEELAATASDIKELFVGIQKIRNKDPILYDKDSRLFGDVGDDVGERGKKPAKKPKKMFLKDAIARNLIENGADFDDDDDDVIDDASKVKSFVEEQKDLRSDVLAGIAAADEAIEEDGGENGAFFREKERNVDEDDENDDECEEIRRVLGEGDELDENSMFLKEYFVKKLWIDPKKDEKDVNFDKEGLLEDEKAIEEQEEYERDYNFRYEENKSDRVLGHSRVVLESVRKKRNARKEARERKEKRVEEAREKTREEVKRLKNLKRKEIQERILKIKEIAGVVDDDGIAFVKDDFDKDFDPVEFDEKMGCTFGESYYNAKDNDPNFASDNDNEDGFEKPDFDKEDELLGLPKNWDVVKSEDGFLAKREDGDGDGEEGKRKRKRKSKMAEMLKKDVEELYKYDYEDTIGDLKTRFKYAKVKPNRYKLSAAEILWLDEQELNQYVSLKKLAPYREDDWKVSKDLKVKLLDGELNGQKAVKKRRGDGEGSSKTGGEEELNVQKAGKKRSVDVEGPSETGGEGVSEVRGVEGGNEEKKLSRSAKRRKSRKEKKLPDSRLVAYGKTVPSSSKKSKN